MDWSSTTSTVVAGWHRHLFKVGRGVDPEFAGTDQADGGLDANGLTSTRVEPSPSAVDIPMIATDPRAAGTQPETAATVPARL